MFSTTVAVAFLSALSRPVLGQADNSSRPLDPLPAANLTSDPIDRTLTTVEIILDPSTPTGPSLTNSTENGEVKTVSYFEAPGLNEPLAIIYGDVILSTVPELLQNVQSNSTDAKVKRALSIFRTDNIWPNAVVTYKWESEAAKGSGRLAEWKEATKRWTNMLPWLKFKEVPASSVLDPEVLTLVATSSQYACFSPIGKQSYSQMLLDDACGGAGTYAHELGHSKLLAIHAGSMADSSSAGSLARAAAT